MRVRSLYSGSSGNSYLLQTDTTAILIDAGGSRRRLVQSMADCGVSPSQVRAVLVTHEHSDHISAIELFRKDSRAPVVANGPTLRAASLDFTGPVIELETGNTITLDDFEVTSFATPHDAVEPAGYIVRSGGYAVAFATDLGHAPESVVGQLRTADLLILEANHDVDMVSSGSYPAHLKSRILGPRGHLSNDQCAEAVLAARNGRARRLWLAHLSAENNRPSIARASVADSLRAAGAEEVVVEVLDRFHPGPFFDTATDARQKRLF